MSADPTLPRPRVTFGMIVLNGEPFLRYNLRALYPFAHQIIVVEGAAPAAVNIATADGHSRDGTLETLKRFKEEEDPENKLVIVTAGDEGHPDGFWPGEKHEQSRAYAKRATGDYLWQVDVDEFYKPEDMMRVLERLNAEPRITAVSFPTITFWGGFDYLTDGWALRRGDAVYHRLFKWGPGFRYTTHRPPTVVDAEGRNLRSLEWWRSEDLDRQGILMYHYSLLFPKQVVEKSEYYGRAEWTPMNGFQRWAQDNYLKLGNPWRVHNIYDQPSWLDRFDGSHPGVVEEMRRDILEGRTQVGVRDCSDVETWLRSWKSRVGRVGLKWLDLWDRSWNSWRGYQQHPVVRLLSLPPRAMRKLCMMFTVRNKSKERLT